MEKFKLSVSEIVRLVDSTGGAIATDRIVVDGCKIGYMYRSSPINEFDTGWRFFEGTEDVEYVNDTQFSGVYDINTIANYDRDIIPYLGLPAGSELERVGDSSEFIRIV